MASSEDEIKELREQNKELVQKVQFWKIAAAEKENEKLNLMKENNELRLKLSRLRNNGTVLAQDLDAALQSASQKALSHMVKASSEIARIMELTKAYMRDRQEMDFVSPRWSAISGVPTSEKKDKIHRVPPLMMGGQSIQPVVALSRTMLNTGNSITRSPNQNRNMTERAVPMHVLQDVYIPLTRIDAGDIPGNVMETETSEDADNSAENLGITDSPGQGNDESQRMSDDDNYESSRRLDSVAEEGSVLEDNTMSRSRLENPLEGPSWLLDESTGDTPSVRDKSQRTLEPDSTTELGVGAVDAHASPPFVNKRNNTGEDVAGVAGVGGVCVRVSCEFSPTVRRRKRTASPPPHRLPRRNSNSGRVLKVLVAKMHLDSSEEEASPPKRSVGDPPSLETPAEPGLNISKSHRNIDSQASGEPTSHHRDSHADLNCHPPLDDPPLATDSGKRNQEKSTRAGTIDDRIRRDKASRAADNESSETSPDRSVNQSPGRLSHDKQTCQNGRATGRSTSRAASRVTSRCGSNESRDSDSGSGGDLAAEGRVRRTRKVVTYKEKPLNRKMRR